jgi:hypothetical protein
MRYQCDICDAVFDKPTVVEKREYLGNDTHRIYSEEKCPICGGTHFTPVSRCESCRGWAQEGDVLCTSCKQARVIRIHDFFDTLSAEEEAQFDAWMDGNSITDRRSWK